MHVHRQQCGHGKHHTCSGCLASQLRLSHSLSMQECLRASLSVQTLRVGGPPTSTPPLPSQSRSLPAPALPSSPAKPELALPQSSAEEEEPAPQPLALRPSAQALPQACSAPQQSPPHALQGSPRPAWEAPPNSLQAKLRRSNRGDIAARPGADDDHVEGCVGHGCSWLPLVRSETRARSTHTIIITGFSISCLKAPISSAPSAPSIAR